MGWAMAMDLDYQACSSGGLTEEHHLLPKRTAPSMLFLQRRKWGVGDVRERAAGDLFTEQAGTLGLVGRNRTDAKELLWEAKFGSVIYHQRHGQLHTVF